jgi:uncharacterized protein
MKPSDVFDRDEEWATLENHVTHGRSGLQPDFSKTTKASFQAVIHIYRLTDPAITFIHSCVEPWRTLSDEGRRSEAWANAQLSWNSQVLGPHLERIAREWTSKMAAHDTIGRPRGIVGRAEISDAKGRITREIDVAVLAPGERAGKQAQVIAIGEVKLTADTDAVTHLDRCGELLQTRLNGRPERLLIFCETATPALRAIVKKRRDLELVDLTRLYTGS